MPENIYTGIKISVLSQWPLKWAERQYSTSVILAHTDLGSIWVSEVPVSNNDRLQLKRGRGAE